jgi:hypothetical protein
METPCQSPRPLKETNLAEAQRQPPEEARAVVLEDPLPPDHPADGELAEEARQSLKNEKPMTLEEARAQVARHHQIPSPSKNA